MRTAQNTLHANPTQDNSWLRTWRTRVAAILLVLLFVISGTVSYQSVLAVHDQDQQVDHFRVIIVTIGVVFSDLNWAEAEAYNYIISGDISQLQSFLLIRPQVSSDLVRLSTLMRGNPVQEERVRTLRLKVPAELASLQTAVNLRQTGHQEAALHFVAAGRDDTVSDTNRALIEALDKTGTQRLGQQMARATTAVRVTTLTILLVALIDLALLAVIFALTRQTIRLRERLAQERAHAKAQTEMQVLQETNRQMDDFISIASHEFRTPLTTVKANLQLARRRILRLPDVTNVLPLIDRATLATGRLERLADDLLDMSRIKADKLVIHPVLFELAELLRDCVSEQQEQHPDRVISLHLSATPSPVVADPDRIRQVITNYLANAFKFSSEEKPVSVEMSLDAEQVLVRVHDEGPGLPASEHQRIWERYHRAPDIERKTGSDVGLGLGLYICKTIITLHGGGVGVSSEVGQGATFYFTLPLAAGPEPGNHTRAS